MAMEIDDQAKESQVENIVYWKRDWNFREIQRLIRVSKI